MAGEDGSDTSRSLHAVRRTARSTARGWLECQAERALGRHYLGKGKAGRGLRHLQASVEALEQARTLIAPEEMHVAFLRDKQAIYEETVGALLARGRRQDIARALEYVERAKSRLLLDRVQEAASLNLLEQEYASLLRQEELAPQSPTGLLNLPDVVAAQDLVAQVSANEALVVYYTVGGSLCAWIVTPQQIYFRPDIACLEAVDYAARRLRYQLQRVSGTSELSLRYAQRFQSDVQTVLTHLYDLLLRPIAGLLTAEQLVVIPHASLHGLPFHAFFNGIQYALDRWEISYAPSAALWHRGALRQQANTEQHNPWSEMKALLVSVPSPGIEQVTEEVRLLASLFPHAAILEGEAATQNAVRTGAEGCRLLHLATHALYRADNPLFSGLQLAAGSRSL